MHAQAPTEDEHVNKKTEACSKIMDNKIREVSVLSAAPG
jgi:hypothetical protein